MNNEFIIGEVLFIKKNKNLTCMLCNNKERGYYKIINKYGVISFCSECICDYLKGLKLEKNKNLKEQYDLKN